MCIRDEGYARLTVRHLAPQWTPFKRIFLDKNQNSLEGKENRDIIEGGQISFNTSLLRN